MIRNNPDLNRCGTFSSKHRIPYHKHTSSFYLGINNQHEYFIEANHCIKFVSILWVIIFRFIRDQWKCNYIWNDHSLDFLSESHQEVIKESISDWSIWSHLKVIHRKVGSRSTCYYSGNQVFGVLQTETQTCH